MEHTTPLFSVLLVLALAVTACARPPIGSQGGTAVDTAQPSAGKRITLSNRGEPFTLSQLINGGASGSAAESKTAPPGMLAPR
jgi:hypothetical protein